jgi:hypothetical protein
MTNPRFPGAVLLRSAIQKRITVKPLLRSTESDYRELSMVTVFFTSQLINDEPLPLRSFDFTLDIISILNLNLFLGCMQEYRVRNDLRAVRLDSDGHGRFTVLSPGCLVQLEGRTNQRGFIEVICEGEKLGVFLEDLEDKSERVADAVPAEEEDP